MTNHIHLPQCVFLEILSEQSKQRQDIDFDFLGELNRFRQRVSAEVRQINVLFPEYTPHDEEYHLKRLFYIADKILERSRFELMNASELFVLAISLYGHDWGMAVSEPERLYITTGKLSEGFTKDSFVLLPDEHEMIDKFQREHGNKILLEGTEEVSIHMWREYVRITHADRSAERVRKYFEPINGGVAEAASRICLGHWISFEQLQQHDDYPAEFSVLGQPINLRALAIYVRLIDLFDIAEDRTPYLIWKFVAPRNQYSKMEWNKHRALQPITCPGYQQGRVIKVNGSTDDHEVYAALEDLKIYCEKQLRGSNDILAHMNDSNHMLDIYHIDWHVRARGFKPVSIQFEFDRERMFVILSDEIYQGDPYVFLRELLQNSIDAIRMRREVLKRQRITMDDESTIIKVEIIHKDNGDSLVVWSDEGIGMDEYIVRNYLAVAGKSYYISEDYKNEGIYIDPISRFGIGILSCFMVADKIEIETRRDPYIADNKNSLHITIPSMERQFRIQVGTNEEAKVGTTIRVFVEVRKIPEAFKREGENKKPLEVTNYLKEIAGFVEFPIIITEHEKKTIIIHPGRDPNTFRDIYGDNYEIHQIDLIYPFEDQFLPQDLDIANKVLKVQSWDINKDLGINNYEGVLSYIVPSDENIIIDKEYNIGLNEYGIRVVDKNEQLNGAVIRWCGRSGGDYYISEYKGISRSSTTNQKYRVFKDGILVPRPRVPEFIGSSYSSILPSPHFIINIKKAGSETLNLSRTEILDGTANWTSQLSLYHLRNIVRTYLGELPELEPKDRLRKIIGVLTYHFVDLNSLWNMLNKELWPLPFLEFAGKLNIVEVKNIMDEVLYIIPDSLLDYVEEIENCDFLNEVDEKLIIPYWKGEPCLIYSKKYYGSLKFRRELVDLSSEFMNESYIMSGIRFLVSPYSKIPQICQRIYKRINNTDKQRSPEDILKKTMDRPNELNDMEIELLNRNFIRTKLQLPEITRFDKPYDEYFCYGNDFVNLNNPITQELIRCGAAIESYSGGKVSTASLGILIDKYRSLFNHARSYKPTTLNDYISSIKQLFEMSRELNLYASKMINEVSYQNLFVEGTCDYNKNNDQIFIGGIKMHEFFLRDDDYEIVEFGTLLN